MSHPIDFSRITSIFCLIIVVIAFECNIVCSVEHANSDDATKQGTIEGIIEALRSHQVSLPRFAMRIESKSFLFEDEPGRFREVGVEVMDVRRRNGMLDLLITRSQDEEIVSKGHHIRTDSYLLIWSHHLGGQGSPANVSLHTAGTAEFTMARTLELGRLIGYLPGDDTPLGEILAHSDRMTLGDQMQAVDGFECYFIEAMSSHGHYEVWVDPSHGYRIRRARVRKGTGDWLNDNKIPPEANATHTMPLRFELSVEDVRLQKVDDAYIPTHEVLTFTQVTPYGKRHKTRVVMRRSNIDLDPQFRAGDFEMTEIPDGTHILNFDETNYGYGYEWREGKVAPVFGGGATTLVGRIEASDMPTSQSDNISIEAEIRPLETVGDKETAGDASLPTPDSAWHEVRVSQDGLLRIEHVPAGRHRLRIKMLELIESGSYKILTDIDREIPVASSDQAQTIDLGVLTFPPIPRLEPGDLAPEFELRAIDGSVVKLSDYRGQFVLLDFWASWCAPCIKEFPHLDEVFAQFVDGKRFSIIGLSSDTDENIWRETVKKHGLRWTQLIMGDEANQIGADYVIYGIPAVFLVGPDGRIVARDLSGDQIDEIVSESLSVGSKDEGQR